MDRQCRGRSCRVPEQAQRRQALPRTTTSLAAHCAPNRNRRKGTGVGHEQTQQCSSSKRETGVTFLLWSSLQRESLLESKSSPQLLFQKRNWRQFPPRFFFQRESWRQFPLPTSHSKRKLAPVCSGFYC